MSNLKKTTKCNCSGTCDCKNCSCGRPNSKKRLLEVQRAIVLLVFAALSLPVIQAAAQQSTMPMNMGPGTTGTGQGAATMAEMSAIHELVVNHDRIQRTVTNLPNGIRTVTESNDLQIAKLIKEHVADMVKRVSAKSDPGLPPESPALHLILRNGDKIQTISEITEQGVVVIQTSTDPAIVAVLQQHASELSDLVQGGIAVLQAAMMKNAGGMMQPGTQARTDQSHDQHLADVNERGDHVMGFDQAKTTHHFLLSSNGGVIQVEANDPKDRDSRDKIRQHLGHVAQLFAKGDFTDPMLIHAQTPPGVAVMQGLKANLKYRVEETARGGRIRITTTNSEALAAVYEFLRFQIKDHATGDSGTVEKP